MPSGLGRRNIGEINSPGSCLECLTTPLLIRVSISLATIACCMRLNMLDHTFSCSGLKSGVNSIFTPVTNSRIVGSDVMARHSDKALTIWPAQKRG